MKKLTLIQLNEKFSEAIKNVEAANNGLALPKKTFLLHLNLSQYKLNENFDKALTNLECRNPE